MNISLTLTLLLSTNHSFRILFCTRSRSLFFFLGSTLRHLWREGSSWLPRRNESGLMIGLDFGLVGWLLGGYIFGQGTAEKGAEG